MLGDVSTTKDILQQTVVFNYMKFRELLMNDKSERKTFSLVYSTEATNQSCTMPSIPWKTLSQEEIAGKKSIIPNLTT